MLLHEALPLPSASVTASHHAPLPLVTTPVITHQSSPHDGAHRRRGADAAALWNGLDCGPGYTVVAHLLAFLAHMGF